MQWSWHIARGCFAVRSVATHPAPPTCRHVQGLAAAILRQHAGAQTGAGPGVDQGQVDAHGARGLALAPLQALVQGWGGKFWLVVIRTCSDSQVQEWNPLPVRWMRAVVPDTPASVGMQLPTASGLLVCVQLPTLAAKWVVTSEEEQAVSTVMAGPLKPKV